MSLTDSQSGCISLETLNYCIEDGALKIVNKDCTEILKKEKKKYIEEFQVSVNPKKDTVFVKKGNEQVYLEIMKKLLNTNIPMRTFKKYMKNDHIPTQNTLPSFNPEKLSDYYQRSACSEVIDFPEPLDMDKINSSELNSETQKRITNSFSEDYSFSDASIDYTNNVENSPTPFKKAKSSFSLNIYMTPNVNSEKMTPSYSNLSNPPQISLATCYDDNSSSSSSNSSSPTVDGYNISTTTLYINQPQVFNANLKHSLNTNSSPTTIPVSQANMTYTQPKTQNKNQYFKNSIPAPLITPPEHTKLDIQFNKKKDESFSYKINGNEAKIQKIRASISNLLHLSSNVEIQKIIFVS